MKNIVKKFLIIIISVSLIGLFISFIYFGAKDQKRQEETKEKGVALMLSKDYLGALAEFEKVSTMQGASDYIAICEDKIKEEYMQYKLMYGELE